MLHCCWHRCERSDDQRCEGPHYSSLDSLHRRGFPCPPVRRSPVRFRFNGGVYPPHVVRRCIGEGVGPASPRRCPSRAWRVPRAQSRPFLFRRCRTDQRLLGSSSGVVRPWGTNQAPGYDFARNQGISEGPSPKRSDSPIAPVALSAQLATSINQPGKEPTMARQKVPPDLPGANYCHS
jgi:hypothetical protein